MASMLTSKSLFFATAVVTETGPPVDRLADAGALAALATPLALAPEAGPGSDVPPQATIKKDAERASSSKSLDKTLVFIERQIIDTAWDGRRSDQELCITLNQPK
jgi:hypothetical protein